MSPFWAFPCTCSSPAGLIFCLASCAVAVASNSDCHPSGKRIRSSDGHEAGQQYESGVAAAAAIRPEELASLGKMHRKEHHEWLDDQKQGQRLLRPKRMVGFPVCAPSLQDDVVIGAAEVPFEMDLSDEDSPSVVHEKDNIAAGLAAPASAVDENSDANQEGAVQGDAHEPAVEAAITKAANLRQQAKREGEAGNWQQAHVIYSSACSLLEEHTSPADGEQVEPALLVVRQLQICRLGLALCLLELREWNEATKLCSEIIRISPRCGTAWYRRGLALQALGRLDAAAWDLERASQLLPKNARVAAALEQAKRSGSCRSTHSGHDDQKALAGLGSGSGGADTMPSLSKLLEGLGAAREGLSASSSSSDGGGSSLFSMLGMEGTSSGDPDANPLEALLQSPLLSGTSGGPLGMLGTLLGYRRRVKRFWRSVTPFIPPLTLIFYFVLLLPLLPMLFAKGVNLLQMLQSQFS
mmetsp:Transcript_52281/g.86714  ORF Transcript_52281/g.86714 Transcript_52281/m.86714 type:complete len:468 (+) Transcript_52281:73-1476(+)